MADALQDKNAAIESSRHFLLRVHQDSGSKQPCSSLTHCDVTRRENESKRNLSKRSALPYNLRTGYYATQRSETNVGSIKGVRMVRMKKLLAVFLMFLTLAFAMPTASAQTRRHRRHRRTFWQKHKDKLTVAGTSAAGAGVGAIAGGKKGAAIGAGAGAGAGAIYAYKIRRRHRHRRRY
jgi:hypothetical protein